jgi:amidohydrolase
MCFYTLKTRLVKIMKKKSENRIYNEALFIKKYLTKIRRKIHQYPELGMQEFKTTTLVKKELSNIGVDIIELNSDVGVLGVIKGSKKGSDKVTAFRADMDALPITERTDLPYASKNKGIMHACGHDGHTAMLLGAAKLLSNMKEKFSGTIKFIFQPDEENLNGAKLMIEEGVLENPKVDTIVALHCWPPLETGKIGVWEGPYMASSDKFSIRISGRGGHGAYPHKSVDSVLTAAELVLALQRIVSREIDSFDNVVLSVCTINGGTAFNVVPDEVIITGTVRCQQTNLREVVKGKIDRIVRGLADSTGCNYSLDYRFGVSSLVNHPDVVNLVRRATEQVLGQDWIMNLEKPAMSSEDFSIYLDKVPHGAFVRIGNTDSGQNPLLVHNDKFNFNDEAIPMGVSVLTQFALNNNQ